jgi:hypothetical protein
MCGPHAWAAQPILPDRINIGDSTAAAKLALMLEPAHQPVPVLVLVLTLERVSMLVLVRVRVFRRRVELRPPASACRFHKACLRSSAYCFHRRLHRA